MLSTLGVKIISMATVFTIVWLHFLQIIEKKALKFYEKSMLLPMNFKLGQSTPLKCSIEVVSQFTLSELLSCLDQ